MTRSVCPWCAVGCGTVLTRRGNVLAAIDGDPDDVVSRGALCERGLARLHTQAGSERLTTCKYRAPGARQWLDVSLPWALERIAARVRETRAGRGPAALATLTGPALDDEERRSIADLFGSLGTPYVERPPVRPTAQPPSWAEVEAARLIVIAGSNVAESLPIGFRCLLRAKENGARIVHVDPRFTRTSAAADLYVPLRSGTDIALFGGLINYALQHGAYSREDLLRTTDAARIVGERFAGPEDLEGLFSGYDPATRSYDVSAWELSDRSDPTLGHERCVLRVLERHFARYTPETIERICGTPPENFLTLCELIVTHGNGARPSIVAYGAGLAEHTVGVQNVRAVEILQMLRGGAVLPLGGSDLHGGARYETRLAFAMRDGQVDGLFLYGRNPAVEAAHASLQRDALERLAWMVVRDGVENESAAFWKREGADPERIATEVFLLPVAAIGEKCGTFTSLDGRARRHEKAVEPPGDARSDLDFTAGLAQLLQAPLRTSGESGREGESSGAFGREHQLFVARGIVDGPLPTHYEPRESPVDNALYPQTRSNPVLDGCEHSGELRHPPADPQHPYVVAICGPPRDRNGAEAIVEISRELAAERKVEHLAWVTLETARGTIEAKAFIAAGVSPFQLGAGRVVHELLLVRQCDAYGRERGDSPNDLAPLAADPNSGHCETKAFTANLRLGRRTTPAPRRA